MEGPWVGTWRPHPRRGPILAEFSTPGPKYWLPGSTGHRGHDPTKDRAPAYTFHGTKCPVADSCSPGPRYFLNPAILKTGKHVAPSPLVTARPKSKIPITPGPSDYTMARANRFVFYSAPVPSMASRHKDLKPFQTPGPGTYTVPRILGPNTAVTHANPCYSMKWKSQYGSCFQDHAKTPGPAAFDDVEMDIYKKRAPQYSM
ncbi:ODF3A protein, partial [Pardalotus punctatus]|nr:ODF3A protein [Pardalotus punctatus]